MTGAASGSLMLSDPMANHETDTRKLNWGRWLILGLMVIGILVFFACGPNEDTIIHRSAEWREMARNHLFVALVIFLAVETTLVAFSVPVGIWLTVLAGFFFGTWTGTAVVNLAGTAGAVLAFLAARYVFAEAIHKSAGSRPRLTRWLSSIDSGFRNHGVYYVFLLRLTPVIPFFAVNLGLGLTSVRLRDYWWATQLGMLPVTLAIANAGASLAEIATFRDVLSFHVLAALCLLPVVPFVLHHTVGRRMMRSV